MNADLKCPQPTTLVDFLLGKLIEPEQSFCESHIADCERCEDTIRGLHLNDTLNNLTRNALVEDSNTSESIVVERLLEDVRQISTDPDHRQLDRLTLERAAEVNRLLVPSDHPTDIARINNYRVTQLLGAGSAGVVYRAFDETLEREVALKILRPSLGQLARDRFLVEAKSAAAVDHPNVITIYEVGQTDALAYLTMQMLPGETLQSRLQREAFLPEQNVRSLAADVARGLQAAHDKELIHRDIKPANIWLTDDDQVKILDFGLARVVNDDPGFTSTGMIAGTPSYMSPEQSKGAALDGRSDLFSLGCVVYRAATGRQPFGASNVLATLQAIQDETPMPPTITTAAVSQDLSDLTMCLLEKLPTNRPPSAYQVATALNTDRQQWDFPVTHYDGGAPSSNQTASPSEKPQLQAATSRSGFGWFGQLVTLLAIGLLGAGGFLFGSDLIRIATGYGQLTIKTDDPDVKIEILEQGKRVRIIDTQTDKQFEIREGNYVLQVAGEENGIEIVPNTLVITRGGKEIVQVIRSSPSSPNDRNSAAFNNSIDASAAVAVEEAKPTKYDPDDPFVDHHAHARQVLMTKIADLKSQIPLKDREQNYELAVAELNLLDNDIEINEQQGIVDPAQFADMLEMLQRRLRTIKRAQRAMLPKLKGQSIDSPLRTTYRKLQTRNKLATDQLMVFESNNKLPRSVPMYDGKTLEDYLQIATTERDHRQLERAYYGIANLADQFVDGSEYFEFVKEVWRKHGSEQRLIAPIRQLTRVLPPADLRQSLLSELETERESNLISIAFLGEELTSEVKAAFGDNPDELFETVLLSKLPNDYKVSILSSVHSRLNWLPADQDLQKLIKELLLDGLKISEAGSQDLILAIDPNSEAMFDLAKSNYYHDRVSSLSLFKRFSSDSRNARLAVPFLIEIAVSLEFTENYIAWAQAAWTLTQYLDSDATAELIAAEFKKFKTSEELQAAQTVLNEMHNCSRNSSKKVKNAIQEMLDRVTSAGAAYLEFNPLRRMVKITRKNKDCELLLEKLKEQIPGLTYTHTGDSIIVNGDEEVFKKVEQIIKHFDAQEESKQANAESANAKPKTPTWRSFARNDYYELFEFPLSKTESIVRSQIAKGDAQLGIGVVMDIAVLADSRGFKYFKPSETPTREELDRTPNHPSDKDAIGSSDLIKIVFLNEKPESADDSVMDVKTWLFLVEQRDKKQSDKEKAEDEAPLLLQKMNLIKPMQNQR